MECELENITVHYEVFGDGRPIVLLHGWSSGYRTIASIMEPIFRRRDGWKRIYPDLPGRGKTPGMDWITHQDQVLDIVLDFIDNVIPGQRFVIVGESYGAYLARGVVYRKSAQLDGLLMTVPVIIGDVTKRALPQHVTLVENPTLLSELEPNEVEFFEQLVVVQSRKLLEWKRADFDPAVEIADTEFLAKLRENYAFSFDVDVLPEPLDKPTLIVVGRQDSVVGYRDAWSVIENYPRATFVVLDRAGKLLEVEQEDLLNVLVNEWLDRVEESAASSHHTRPDDNPSGQKAG